MVVVYFAIIAVMRVIQKVCAKKASKEVNGGITFFHYGGYYQLLASAFALVTLCFVGFYSFNLPTVLCSLISALLFALDLYTSLEAIKGASLVVCNMFALGGLFVPCIVGIFLFDEPMSLWQWGGLVVFILSIYFLSAKPNKEEKNFTLRTFIMLTSSFLINGLIMVVQKYFAVSVPNSNEAMFSFLTFGFNAVILYACMAFLALFKNRNEQGEKVNEVKPLPKSLLVCGGLLALALFIVNLLVTTMSKTIPSVVLFTVSSSLSILITCLVGCIMFKEKLTWKNIVGIALGAASIIIVNAL